MHKRGVILVILSIFLIILSALSIYGQSETPTGVFNISNLLPDAPYAWTPVTTHYKNQTFNWTQPADANGDPITTYLCITNDTDSDTCQVVNTQTASNTFGYIFTQAEAFWDYAPFGTASRNYYVNLTPNDGFGNGTSNSTISYTLTDAIPTITGQTSNSTTKGDAEVGNQVLFFMTSHGDTDVVDNQSIVVCNSSSITTSGTCTDTQYCTSGGFTADTNLNCTYNAQQADNTSNLAYFYICDCVPGDQSCPSQCSNSYSTTFFVNHAPYVTNADITPDLPSSAQDLFCNYTFNDIDADTEGTTTFRWFNFTGSSYTLTSFTTQTLSNSVTNNGDTWLCEITPVDQYNFAGTAANSTNESIGNAPPNQPTTFTIQDSPTTYDTTYPIDSHDVTPFLNWSTSDPDADPVTTYVCIASSAANRDADICDVNETTTTSDSVTILSGPYYNGTSMDFFVRLTPYDGSQNGTVLDTNFTIINQFPNTPTDLSPLSTHNQTPTLSWNISDPDDGSVDRWPADTVTSYVRVGTSYGDGSYENNDLGNNNSEIVDNPIPWGTPGPIWANTTAYVSIWTTDGNLNSSYYNTTLTLSDYLPDVTSVEMTDIGAYSECTASAGGCALSPVEGSNTSVAVRINSTDIDNDCDIVGTADINLCLFTSGVCNSTTANYSYSVDNVQRTGSNCVFTFTANKTAADGTPEFFRPANDSYLLRVDISSQAGTRTSDTEANRLWEYGLLKAIDYPAVVILGGGNPVLGQWNNGTDLALMTNYGNDPLNLLWNSSDPTSGSDTWVLNGTDMQIDDDNDFSSEPAPISPTFLNYTLKSFEPSNGLDRCVEYSCATAGVNETLDTYYHIAPPFGLSAGQYNNTITIQIS